MHTRAVLRDVCQFMRQQVLAAWLLRLVLTARESDVGAQGEGARSKRSRRGVGRRAGVQSHGAKVLTVVGLEGSAQPDGQGSATGQAWRAGRRGLLHIAGVAGVALPLHAAFTVATRD